MRTTLWYSSLLNRARPIPSTFCTGGHAWKILCEYLSNKPEAERRKPASLNRHSKPAAPTPAPASRGPPHPRNPGAAPGSTPRPLPTPHSRAPASTGRSDGARLAVPTAPSWSRGRAESSPALPPSAFPACRRSGREVLAKTGPTRGVPPAVSATRQTGRAPAPTAPGHRYSAAEHPRPPPPAPIAVHPARPRLIRHAAPNGFHSGTRTSQNSNSAAGGSTPTPPPSPTSPILLSPDPAATLPAAAADNSSGLP